MKKILLLPILLLMLALTSCFTKDEAPKLKTPTINFEEKTSVLSWSEVENATSYVVSINNEEIRVEDTMYKVHINVEITQMKVKAKSNGEYGEYKDSNWSKSITYKVEKEDTQKTLRLVISEFLDEDVELKDIISVDIKGKNIHIVTSTIEKDKNFSNVMLITYDNTITSLKDALLESSLQNAEIWSASNAETVEYDTMSEIIKNKKYCRNVADYVAQGYTVSVVNSATQKYNESNQKASYDVYGLLKLTKGNETKFIDVSYRVRTDKSKGDNSYIDYIANSDRTTVYVNYSNELSGDAYEYAVKLAEEMGK